MGYPISKSQIAAIWTLTRESGIGEANMRAIVLRVSAQESLKALTWQQANNVIDALKRAAGQEIAQRKSGSGRRATGGQQRKILALASAMGWDSDPERLRGWLRKIYKVDDVGFLTPGQAGKCIATMQRMHDEGRAERRTTNDIDSKAH